VKHLADVIHRFVNRDVLHPYIVCQQLLV
jgi:hypothetical protein